MERFRREYAGMDVICCDSPEKVAENADAVVLVTEWPQYRDLEWEAIAKVMRTPILFDGRNALDAARLRRIGFRYIGIGTVEPATFAQSAHLDAPVKA